MFIFNQPLYCRVHDGPTRGISCDVTWSGVMWRHMSRIAQQCQAEHTSSKRIYSTFTRHDHRYYYNTMDTWRTKVSNNQRGTRSCDVGETLLLGFSLWCWIFEPGKAWKSEFCIFHMSKIKSEIQWKWCERAKLMGLNSNLNFCFWHKS